ncbi:MAG: hypothetical protein ACYDAZ_05720 [Thermoplasmataceae archaeon]
MRELFSILSDASFQHSSEIFNSLNDLNGSANKARSEGDTEE